MASLNASNATLSRSPVASRKLDRDKLSMVPRWDAARAAMTALDRLQDMTPEEVLLGTATLFAAMCRRCGIEPSAAHGMGMKVLEAPWEGDKQTDTTLQVLRDFAGVRLMGQEVSIS